MLNFCSSTSRTYSPPQFAGPDTQWSHMYLVNFWQSLKKEINSEINHVFAVIIFHIHNDHIVAEVPEHRFGNLDHPLGNRWKICNLIDSQQQGFPQEHFHPFYQQSFYHRFHTYNHLNMAVISSFYKFWGKGILDRQQLQRTDGSSEGYPWIRILRLPLDSYWKVLSI